MGYEALLFCPDEKTARTVTQVLSELEFNVESCLEPFAAVKKLMGQHFDAVVVDCDNEQNATLLFKSARNSTSNQASLAVAVVEGQAGVAKAFRIGANLVLTKPINIEQAKGTLRVARGLLRKGDPSKPAGESPTLGMPSLAMPPVLKPAAPKPPVAAKPVAPRPAAPAVQRPTSPVAPVRPAMPAPVAQAAPAVSKVEAPAPAVEIPPAPVNVAVAPPVQRVPEPTIPPVTETKPMFSVTPASSGAASAPARAREVQEPAVHAAPTPSVAEVPAVVEKPIAAAHTDVPSFTGAAASFTFGGANLAAEPSGASKKIFIGIAAAAVVAVGLYFGWTKFHGHANEATTQPTVNSAPARNSQAPVSAQANTTSSTMPTETTSPSAQPTVNASTNSSALEANSEVPEHAAAPASAKPSPSPSAVSKVVVPAKPEEAPLMVKGGSAPVAQAPAPAPDTPAPSMIGMGDSGAMPANLVNSGNSPAPVLQRLKISQGVSTGLLYKRVQPVYPRNALLMKIEGAVELDATISKEGDISNVKVLGGDKQLTKAAVDAVKQWKYKPYLLNGEPVEIQTQITINFKLPN